MVEWRDPQFMKGYIYGLEQAAGMAVRSSKSTNTSYAGLELKWLADDIRNRKRRMAKRINGDHQEYWSCGSTSDAHSITCGAKHD